MTIDVAMETHHWVKDIQENERVSGLYLVKTKRAGLTKKGDPFLSLTLTDRSGEIEARVWERVEELSPLFREGDILEVEGYAGSFRNRIQVTLSNLKPSEDGGDSALFMECSDREPTEMMVSLRELLKGVRNPHLGDLLKGFLSDRQFISQFKQAPAAKSFHHNYLGGLLEHTLSVCQMAGVVTDHYPELDKDLLLTAAFLHDIGKVRELGFDRRIDYTDEGRLLGHLMLGVAMVDEKITGLKTFPRELAVRLKHLILSHHGEYAFGSPKRPKFLEAFALHFIDDLDAKMKGLGRFMERDQQEGDWTDFNRLFDRYFLKGNIQSHAEETETPAVDDKQKTLFS